MDRIDLRSAVTPTLPRTSHHPYTPKFSIGAIKKGLFFSSIIYNNHQNDKYGNTKLS
jgi:hypothetical protein